jgi:N-acetylglucosamine-6-phosphate deacetylase
MLNFPHPSSPNRRNLVDLHVNGLTLPARAGAAAEVVNFSSESLTLDQVRRATEGLVAAGTRRYLATLITSSPESMIHNVRLIADAMKQPWGEPIMGIHLEGPFFSVATRGAHPKNLVREEADIGLFRRFFDASDGKVVLMTVSPAIRGAAPFIEQIARMGVVVSIGHHNAVVSQIEDAFAAGATGVTHAGNAWSKEEPPDHRKNMEVAAQLLDPNAFVMIIPDGVHVDRNFIKYAFIMVESRKPNRTIWVSDGSAFAGAPAGRYEFGGEPVDIGPDSSGQIRTFPLTGSYLTISQCLEVLASMKAVPDEAILPGATTIPLDFMSSALKRIDRFPDLSSFSEHEQSNP